jgi:ABC-type branched-subunit amino acid transport system ATPase component
VAGRAEQATVTEAATPVLRTVDLTVHFGGVTAISGISLDVSPGEIVAIIGPNGAGKTTILNAILGLVSGSMTGHVELFGRPARRGQGARVRLGIGRSFQDPKLLEGETILENVLIGAEVSLRYSPIRQLVDPFAVNRAESAIQTRAFELLDIMGLAPVAHRPLAGLPYGSRKLVDLARALVASPRLLLLDEPTSGVHGSEQQRVTSVLREVRARFNTATVLVEHHMDIVRTNADRVVGLQAGRVLVSGSAQQVLESNAFREAIVGGSTSVHRGAGGSLGGG